MYKATKGIFYKRASSHGIADRGRKKSNEREWDIMPTLEMFIKMSVI